MKYCEWKVALRKCDDMFVSGTQAEVGQVGGTGPKALSLFD